MEITQKNTNSRNSLWISAELEENAEKVIKVTELIHGNIGNTAEFNNDDPICVLNKLSEVQ